MADRPILFSAPMIRALLAGTKTQTRRLLSPQPIIDECNNLCAPDRTGKIWNYGQDEYGTPHLVKYAIINKRIKHGDRLWVREGWWIATHYSYGTTPGGCKIDPPPLACRKSDPVHYIADGDPPNCANRHYGAAGLRVGSGAFAAPDPYAVWSKRPSIHMPRWASRITLIVTDVRVQRLQDISAADANAEGVTSTEHWRPKDVEGKPFGDKWWDDATFWAHYPQLAYASLWNHINGAGAWEANPWVVAYSFTAHVCNIDQMEGADG